MFSLVLDCSSLIPCGEKSEEEKEAIRFLGSALYKIEDAIVYLSPYLVKLYQNNVVPLLKYHHPLPNFQVSLCNLLPNFRKLTGTRKCKTIPSKAGIKFHILEETYVQHYDVDDVGLTREEDKEVLRIAIASAHQETFLVTTDRHFLENLDWIELSKRYSNQCSKIKVVKPNDCYFIRLLESKFHNQKF